MYVYILSLRGDTKASPLALSVGLPHFNCLQKPNNSAIWLLPSRCFQDDLHGSDHSTSPTAFEFPPSLLGILFSLTVRRCTLMTMLRREKIVSITMKSRASSRLQVVFQMYGSKFKPQNKWLTAPYGVKSCAIW